MSSKKLFTGECFDISEDIPKISHSPTLRLKTHRAGMVDNKGPHITSLHIPLKA